MAKVDISAELLATHSDEELTEFLDLVLSGVLRNYQSALKADQPDILFGSLGDIVLVSSIVREMKKRNTARQTPPEVV